MNYNRPDNNTCSVPTLISIVRIYLYVYGTAETDRPTRRFTFPLT